MSQNKPNSFLEILNIHMCHLILLTILQRQSFCFIKILFIYRILYISLQITAFICAGPRDHIDGGSAMQPSNFMASIIHFCSPPCCGFIVTSEAADATGVQICMKSKLSFGGTEWPIHFINSTFSLFSCLDGLSISFV